MMILKNIIILNDMPIIIIYYIHDLHLFIYFYLNNIITQNLIKLELV